MAGSDGDNAPTPLPHSQTASLNKPDTRILTAGISSVEIDNAISFAKALIQGRKDAGIRPEEAFPEAAALDGKPEELLPPELAAFLLSKRESSHDPAKVIARAKEIFDGMGISGGERIDPTASVETQSSIASVKPRVLSTSLT